MPRIIEPADITNAAEEWEVELGLCKCGWYRFYHAGCGHLYVTWKHCCGKNTKIVATVKERFCYTPAPATNVQVLKIKGLCHECNDPTPVIKTE
jgi:hypothetical protein